MDPDPDPADQGGKILQFFFPGKFHSLMSHEAAVTEILVTTPVIPHQYLERWWMDSFFFTKYSNLCIV
jgi:hypothetical protein